jgi:hypothetical protein
MAFVGERLGIPDGGDDEHIMVDMKDEVLLIVC